jgi:hypothetical protein
MRRIRITKTLTAKLLATALSIGALPMASAISPAAAQQLGITVNFNDFHRQLAPYGVWYHHARWGDVWHPTRVERDFRPYDRGHWQNTTEYGWLWVADDNWGDIPFHYGRWVYDPNDGWLWLPGYVWSPAWVVWRSGGGYVGWFPMPPDDRFLAGDETYRDDWNDWDRSFGYTDWYGPQLGLSWSSSIWIFVDQRHFDDRDFHRWTAPTQNRQQFLANTVNITNYTTVNNYIVNRSVDPRAIERAAGHPVAAVAARDVLGRNALVTPIDAGKQIQQREQTQHGGDAKASAHERVTALPSSGIRVNLPVNPAAGDQNRGLLPRAGLQGSQSPANAPAPNTLAVKPDNTKPDNAAGRQNRGAPRDNVQGSQSPANAPAPSTLAVKPDNTKPDNAPGRQNRGAPPNNVQGNQSPANAPAPSTLAVKPDNTKPDNAAGRQNRGAPRDNAQGNPSPANAPAPSNLAAQKQDSPTRTDKGPANANRGEQGRQSPDQRAGAQGGLNPNAAGKAAEPDKAAEQPAKRVFAAPASKVPPAAEIAKANDKGGQDNRPTDRGKEKDKQAN